MQAVLFLGFVVDASLEAALAAANPYAVALFTQGEAYLSERLIDQKRYLGKTLPHPLSLGALEESERHLLSLLRKLLAPQQVTHYPLLVQMYTVRS